MELDIQSEAFAEARMNFDMIIKALLKDMIEQQIADGTLVLRVQVSIKPDVVTRVDTATGEYKEQLVYVPSFKTKVNSTMSRKYEAKSDYFGQYMVDHLPDGSVRLMPLPDEQQRLFGAARDVD